MDTNENSLPELVASYGEAWNTHDLDAIVAHHTDDSTFHMHIGDDPVVGVTALREAFAASLSQWPDIHFAVEDLRFGPDHVVARWAVTAALASPLETPDGRKSAPTGQQISFDAVDVLVWRNGQIARKDTYVDAISLQIQLAAQSAS